MPVKRPAKPARTHENTVPMGGVEGAAVK